MKHILFIFASLFAFISHSQTSQIDFESGNWESAIKKANKENKLIFVDAFTTWCGPCKMMSKTVFTDDRVSSHFNENFINMKIDMEKGEGILFAKAYGVNAFPTFVFVDSKGNIAHKGVGYQDADKFIALANVALDEESRYGTLAMKYENGERDPVFLKKYAEVLSNAYDENAADVALEYLNTQDDWSSSDNAKFLIAAVDGDPNSPLFSYMADHRTEFIQHGDVDEIDYKLKMGLMRKVHHDKLNAQEQESLYGKVFGDKGGEYYAEYQMRKYGSAKDPESKQKYAQAAVNYINNYNITDWSILNSVAWTFYESIDDKEYLMHARKWAKTSVDQKSSYMNNDTLAALCYKLGDKKSAKKYAKNAIKLANENGEDATETEKLLAKINAL